MAQKVQPARNDDWRVATHLLSMAMWGSSLDNAVKKGGASWAPVILGGLGHLIAFFGGKQ